MADPARLLPRHWDGQRLVRFLAGLAVVVLGLLTPAVPATAAVPPAPAAAEAAPAAPTAPAVQVPVTSEVRAADKVEPCRHGGHVGPATPDIAAGRPVGVVPAASGSRGPPAAHL